MKTAIGAYLIDTPFSALNNRGKDPSAAFDNTIATKTIRSPEGERPYVSAQALRYWWRNILKDRYEWKCSPVEKISDKNQAVTESDPVTYPDDDIFGYMCARKMDTGKKNSKGKPVLEDATVTRVSPLKCSPLIGFPIKPITDLGVMNRDFEGDPVRFDHRFYSNILKGIFAIDLDAAGKFTAIDKAGSMNLSTLRKQEYEKQGLKSQKVNEENIYYLPVEQKKIRVTQTIFALKYLNGGAMQTLHHTDVTPKMIILAVLNGGNNIFMDVFPHRRYDDGLINLDALNEVLTDYKQDLLSGVYIGRMAGFGSEKDKELDSFKAPDGVNLTLTTPAQAIDGFVAEISKSEKIFGA
ncbi:MAG TPA: type I-B CRISPR-associated protein Cas7/Cst2/DevR [Methanoregula sp.]|nr:type I-B CRISPR-associated protein Cas7/Cst2/DevR [Methanoregula sp.]